MVFSSLGANSTGKGVHALSSDLAGLFFVESHSASGIIGGEESISVSLPIREISLPDTVCQPPKTLDLVENIKLGKVLF